jgi:hypothetical protein
MLDICFVYIIFENFFIGKLHNIFSEVLNLVYPNTWAYWIIIGCWIEELELKIKKYGFTKENMTDYFI